MKTETNPLSVLDPLVTITELAEYLGVPVKTIYEWRQTGEMTPVINRIKRARGQLVDVKKMEKLFLSLA